MTDYEQIAEEHREYYGKGISHLRIYKQLYSDKTHFVYELVQNADDNKSRHLELQLGKNNLLVWNDGCQFSEEDVRSICSIGLSNKDLTQIGTFGIGFKAVYNYTDLPEIYSGNERFCIRHLIEPKGIDEMPPRVIEHVNQGRTVFRLPFKDRLDQKDIVNLKNRLCDLERSLLFLRHLETIQWRDEHNGQTGSYSCHHCPHDQIQNASQVELRASMNGENQLSETFLVFCREVQPPQEVIDELLQQAEDDEEQHRIQQSAKKQQPVEVAFKLSDGRITPMDSPRVLFAYLPTKKETHLRFLIQGRYQTTPARDNMPIDNPWNKWLVRETANFLPEVLEQLKAGGLLEPMFFNVLPLEDDGVQAEFEPIADALGAAMKNHPLVPTQDGGYAKAESVFYPHTEALRKLIESSWLHPDSSWLHPDIRDTEKFRQCFKVMREAGVRDISASQVLGWFEAQSLDWFKGRPNEWLCSLYVYLKEQRAELDRIKKLPLVRLENGKHVCASNQLAFFRPHSVQLELFSPDEEPEEIRPFLNELPILMSALLEGDERNDIEVFLKNLGVRVLDPEQMIREWIIPQYSQSDNPKPSVEKNRLHLRYLFKVWDKISGTERSSLKEKISEIPIIQAYGGVQRETHNFIPPCNAYLPQAYTGDADLETYFSMCDDVWFVNDGYLESDAESGAWLWFLKEIGSMDHPQLIEEKLFATYEECIKRGFDQEHVVQERQTIEYHYIEDHYVDSLSKALSEISKSQEADLSQALWRLLVKAVPPASAQRMRNKFFQGAYHWFYQFNHQKSFDATFYRQLKKTAWLPDEQGKFRSPSEFFAPTAGNRRVLGDSVSYLHPDFDISEDNEPRRWLAEKLGVHLNADTESVLNYLQTLSSTTVSVEDIKPLYHFLDRQDARPREKFEEERLIFTPSPEPCWWQTNQAFGVDERVVFGDHRGYLEAHYSETLKPFFIALGVSERASRLDYVQGIREVTSEAQAGDVEVHERVKILYGRLWGALQEDSSLLEDEDWREEWEQTRKGRYWLGKKGSEWGFFYPDELVRNDHNHRAHLFEDRIPFWTFNDLSDFATKYLSVESCSQAEVKFHPSGAGEKDEGWSDKVRDLCRYIDAFFKSPGLCNRKYEEVKSAQVLDRLSVRLVEKLEMAYQLKGISVPDPEPRPSFLDATDQEVTLWLGLKAHKDEYADLIGDALQDYFDIKELREFAKDLLLEIDPHSILSRWKQRGLRTDFCMPSETFSEKEEEKPVEPIDEKLPVETRSADDDSEGNGSEPHTHHLPPGAEDISSHGGHWGGTSDGGGGGGGHGGGGGGGEGQPHRNLKEYLADNPSQLSEGLALVKVEYTFKSNDRVDILLKDSSGKPVTVEVETHISSKNDMGILQAVMYKHLAAVEYGLPCEQVRSILAAPKIPDNVKAKCEQLGIEPKEVTMPSE